MASNIRNLIAFIVCLKLLGLVNDLRQLAQNLYRGPFLKLLKGKKKSTAFFVF